MWSMVDECGRWWMNVKLIWLNGEVILNENG